MRYHFMSTECESQAFAIMDIRIAGIQTANFKLPPTKPAKAHEFET
jgi:hypothetical protein